MRKRILTALVAMVMAAAMNLTAFAGTWQKDSVGWWWQNDDGSYPVSSWQWLDGNGDGVAECYYFNEVGYMLANTTTPDGYQVNTDGAWVVDGAVQTKQVAAQQAQAEDEWIHSNDVAQDNISDENGSNHLSSSALVEIMELIVDGLREIETAERELADAARSMSVGAESVVPSLARSSQLHFGSAAEYLSEGINKCAGYEELQKLKQLLNEMVNELSECTTYTLTGSVDEAATYMVSVLDSAQDMSVLQNEIKTELDILMMTVQEQ